MSLSAKSAAAGVLERKPRNNFWATAAPTASDDRQSGYRVGSVWIDVTANKAYICVDESAGAADWNQIDAAGGGGSATIQDVYDNSASGKITTDATRSDVEIAGGEAASARIFAVTRSGDKFVVTGSAVTVGVTLNAGANLQIGTTGTFTGIAQSITLTTVTSGDVILSPADDLVLSPAGDINASGNDVLGVGSVQIDEASSVPGGAPSAGDGKLWVRNDSPNVIVYTDDGGNDYVLNEEYFERLLTFEPPIYYGDERDIVPFFFTTRSDWYIDAVQGKTDSGTVNFQLSSQTTANLKTTSTYATNHMTTTTITSTWGSKTIATPGLTADQGLVFRITGAHTGSPTSCMLHVKLKRGHT